MEKMGANPVRFQRKSWRSINRIITPASFTALAAGISPTKPYTEFSPQHVLLNPALLYRRAPRQRRSPLRTMAELIFLCSSTVTRSLSALVRRTSGIDTTMQQLQDEGRELIATRDEVETAVAAAERQQWVPRSEVKRWLERTDQVLTDLDAFERRYWAWRDNFQGVCGFLLTCGCPLFCGYALGARAADLLMQVQELKGQRIDQEAVARPPPFLAIEKIPPSTLGILGYEGTLAEVRCCLKEDAVGVIGICGMGGGLKSSLLTTINNDAQDLISTGDSGGFDVVIWINRFKDFTVEKLRLKITKRCCLLQHHDGDDLQLRQLLFNFLSRKRFLLMLNEMWTSFDLVEVGIPHPDAVNKSKVIFATESDYVCREMEPDRRFEIRPLNELDSWRLFRTRVPAEILDTPSIRVHAEALLAACGGLPFTIIRVGRTMASKKRPLEWELASRMIHESPMELRGMSDVINELREGFDGLSSDLSRRCFLHCPSVFHDRDQIYVEELIDSWVESGLLCDYKVEEARARGYTVVEDLKALFLLHTCGEESNQVKLHPMHRIMALHIAKESRQS